jgi:hypothetical protein
MPVALHLDRHRAEAGKVTLTAARALRVLGTMLLAALLVAGCNPRSVSFGGPRRYAVTDDPTDFEARDLEDDQDVELTVVSSATEDGTIRRNDGAGHFDKGYTRRISNAPLDVIASDLTGDGHPELIVGHPGR